MRLGFDFLSKIKLFLLGIWLVFKTKLNINFVFSIRVKLLINNKVFKVHLSNEDLFALRDVVSNKDYFIETNFLSPKVIIDLGSNVGWSVLYFISLYPEAKIYAFEPDPRAFSKLSINTQLLDNVSIFNIAITDKDGDIPIYLHPSYSTSSSVINRKKNYNTIIVRSQNLLDFVIDQKITTIDILKFDIEGAEKFLVEKELLKKVLTLVGEVHLDLLQMTRDQFLRLLVGFKITTDSAEGDRFIIKGFKDHEIRK